MIKHKVTGLNKDQEEFCRLYVMADKEFFGNGVQSYCEAYDIDFNDAKAYKSAAANASRLLKQDKIIARINNLLEEIGFNDAFVDKQLSFVITQYADLNAKVNGIKEYNKLKQRITEKQDITSGGKPIVLIDAATAQKYGIAPSTEGNSKWYPPL